MADVDRLQLNNLLQKFNSGHNESHILVKPTGRSVLQKALSKKKNQ